MKRRTKYLLIPAGVTGAVFLAAGWLLFTDGGQETLVRRALPLVPGLTVESADGGLRDLTLRGLTYEMPGLTVSAERIHLGFAWRALFNQHLKFTDLTLEGVKTVLNTAELPASDASAESAQPSEPITDLRAPLPLTVERLALSRIHTVTDGIETRLDDFSLSLTWRNRVVTVGETELKGLTVTLPAEPEAAPEDAVEAKPAFPAPSLGETLTALFEKPLLTELPAIALPVDLDLKRFEATGVRVNDALGTPTVTVNRAVLSARLDKKALTLHECSADLPEAAANLTGTIGLTSGYELALKGRAESRLEPAHGEAIDFTLKGPLSGRLSLFSHLTGPVTAEVRLEAEPAQPWLPLRLYAATKEVTWPLDAGDAPKDEEPLAVRDFTLTLDGTVRDYLLGAQTRILVPGVPRSGTDTAGIRLEGKGTLTTLNLTDLRIKAADGAATLKASLGWADAITAQGDLTLTGFALKHFVPTVDAVLSGKTAFAASMKGSAWAADLETLTLTGTVDQQTLTAEGSLKAALSQTGALDVNTPGLDLRLGANHVHAKGRFDGRAVAADLRIDAPDLQVLMPGLSGRVTGSLVASGTVEKPVLDADLTAGDLGFEGMTLKTLTLKGRAAADPTGLAAGDMTLTAAGAELPGFRLDTLTLGLTGTETVHRLRLDAAGELPGDPKSRQKTAERLSAGLTLEGGFNRQTQTWTGALTDTAIETPLGRVAQDDAAKLVLNVGKRSATLSEHCWRHHDAEVCLEKPLSVSDSGQNGTAALALRRFDLGFLKPWLPRETAITGTLTGSADASWHLAESALPQVKVTLEGHNVAVKQTVGEQSLPLSFDALTLSADVEDNLVSAEWLLSIAGNGSLNGRLAVTDPTGKKAMSGDFGIRGIDLSMVNCLIPSGEKAEGTMNADLQAGGTLDNPELFGNLSVESVRVRDGAVPLEMKPSRLDVTFAGRESRLDGVIDTAQGRLDVKGSADWRDIDRWLAEVSAKGKKILVTVPPMARVWVSPDVTFKADPAAMALSGRIDIPKARIEVTELPESAVSVSGDEVMLDENLQPLVEKTPSVPMTCALKIGIGDDVRVSAFGLRAKLSGDVDVKQDQRGLSLNGLVNVDSGRFHAYGQDLQVRKGQVVFAGAADQPLLHIEAIRNPDAVEDNVVAGIRVTGTAARPAVTLFSEPALSQQETLSYLVRGQGLGTETDSNSALTSALIGLGISQTGSVVSKIGSAVGIDNLGIDTEGVGESSQVVVSGYVLPGLQVKYGVGIFDSLATLTLRYRLMPKLYLEAVSGANQVVDLLYRFEY